MGLLHKHLAGRTVTVTDDIDARLQFSQLTAMQVKDAGIGRHGRHNLVDATSRYIHLVAGQTLALLIDSGDIIGSVSTGHFGRQRGLRSSDKGDQLAIAIDIISRESTSTSNVGRLNNFNQKCWIYVIFGLVLLVNSLVINTN